jgi:hypothetical protein
MSLPADVARGISLVPVQLARAPEAMEIVQEDPINARDRHCESARELDRVKLRTVAFLIVVDALSQHARASCVFTPGRVVRATVVRCESARPYLEAADRAHPYAPPLRVEDGRVVTGPPVDRAKLSEQESPGTILVLRVTSELNLLPAKSTRGITGLHADRAWRDVVEYTRVWWRGPSDICSKTLDSMELWLHSPCCDLVPALGACLATIDLGEPLPADIKELVKDVALPRGVRE